MGVRPLAGAVAQLLEHRHFDAHGALHLQGGVGDVVILQEEFLDIRRSTPACFVLYSGSTSTWADRARIWEQMVQMLRWWTSFTPSTARMASATSAVLMPRGTPSSRMWADSLMHPPGAPEDDEADADGDDRVEHVPAGEIHHDAADDDPDRGGGVADHVEEGAPDVEVVVGVLVQRPGRHQVHDEADGGDDRTSGGSSPLPAGTAFPTPRRRCRGRSGRPMRR